MELKNKVGILADAAKYDVSCSSSGSSREGEKGSLGHAVPAGICHSWSDDGRCISLLKILMTNNCIYDCKYCVNRVSNDVPRVMLTPDELVYLTINFYRRNYIEGLFLSSGVFRSPDYTMELMIEAIKKLRYEYNFQGYIHLKAIPGCDRRLLTEAGMLADRMSVNIETPTSDSLKLLAPQKNKEALVGPMYFIKERILEERENRRIFKASPKFIPAGQSTQLIVGATPESDLRILTLSQGLYRRLQMKRVYYSAYMPVVFHPMLPAVEKPPLLREHRLYQADWLLRFYGFSAEELLDYDNPNLDSLIDPKSDWAVRNYHLFPVEINKAEYEMLLRVPGIGVKSAEKILRARRIRALDYDNLKKIGVVLKRARHFITCKGKFYGSTFREEYQLRQQLMPYQAAKKIRIEDGEQLSFFSQILPRSEEQSRFLVRAGEV
ncbi:MAG: putative DNA modification/repair radical SAM protein [Caldicoprobacterales bacterium]|jgi:putative DNA modification/repair radical SAM protein|nr:putative DNA modification/repair radical SAM protein [Clostridiales bacterium]